MMSVTWAIAVSGSANPAMIMPVINTLRALRRKKKESELEIVQRNWTIWTHLFCGGEGGSMK